MRRALFSALILVGALTLPCNAAETFQDCRDCPIMVSVPAGSFMMGSMSDETEREGAVPEDMADERPRHQVVIRKPFAMGALEVSRDQFAAFVRETGHQAGGPCWVWNQTQHALVESSAYDWHNPGFSQTGDHPVACVNWNDAQAYVHWLSLKTGKGYRLPTEAEWEYAARANTTTARYWGDLPHSACGSANVSDQSRTAAQGVDLARHKIFPCTDSYPFTAPGGKFKANAFGLYDMLGNVWEWTEDCYHKSYRRAPTNGSAWIAGNCALHVIRGGSWAGDPWGVRSAERDWDPATFRLADLGFRVARTN